MTIEEASQYEPCILKHNSRYDDPYTFCNHTEKYKADRAMCYYIMAYDIERSLVVEYPSIADASTATGILQQTVRSGMKHKHKVKGRYFFAFSSNELMETMHKHGYQ